MDVGPKLSTFLQDAERFNLQTTHIAARAPLQIYAYGLLFAPSESIVKKIFSKEIPRQIHKHPVMNKTWSANRQTLEGHSDVLRLMGTL